MEGQNEGQNNYVQNYQSAQSGGPSTDQPPVYGAYPNVSGNNTTNSGSYNSNVAKYDDVYQIGRNITVAHYQSQVYNNTVQPGMMGVNNNDYNSCGRRSINALDTYVIYYFSG
eukprot:472742_1